jgi:hypothetical protein
MIADAEKYLRLLGIGYRLHHTPRRPPNKAITRVVIGRRADVIRFIRVIGSAIPYKRRGMAAILRWHRRPGQPRRTRWYGPAAPDPAELLRLREQGLTKAQIAEQLGLTFNAVGHYLKQAQLTRPIRTGPQPDPEDVRRAYWDEHLSLEATGARFGYQGRAVARFMRQHGIPRRKGGHPVKIS